MKGVMKHNSHNKILTQNHFLKLKCGREHWQDINVECRWLSFEKTIKLKSSQKKKYFKHIHFSFVFKQTKFLKR